DEPDSSFTLEQWQRFQNVLNSLKNKGIDIEIPHAANSGGILKYPQSQAALVRLGISLYGYYPSQGLSSNAIVDLKPVLSLKSRLAFIKKVPAGFPVSYGRTYYTRSDTVLATVPVGYADGLNRHLSNVGFALVRGRKVPIVGRVCMDQVVLDISALPEARLEDEVVFYGTQGGETISVEEVAKQLGTISYEVLCAVGKRIPRAYIRNGKLVKVLSFYSKSLQ
ncbi:MAG: alanine racemase, partial [Firmicutes bacterium]|nr:alanine racemase [Bacillota bacterium]